MTSTAPFGAGTGLWFWQPHGRLSLWATVATVSFTSYILGRASDEAAATAFDAVGVGACGWAWLAARALFDPAERDASWASIVAGVVALTGAVSVFGFSGAISRVAENAYVISGSAALLLTFVEPFLRWRADLPAAEIRFRYGFTAVYSLLVAASVMGLWAEGEGATAQLRDDLIKGGCALIGLVGLWLAVGFRRRQPLCSTTPRRVETPKDAALAERLMNLLVTEDLAARPELKIGEVAARLGQPEYRVSRAIKAALGFANFNRWINHHRIARAKTLLADPTEFGSITQVAFACGFASLGPFNRAFRDETGMTPRRYRQSQRLN